MVISFFYLVDVVARLVVVKRGFTCFLQVDLERDKYPKYHFLTQAWHY